MEFNVNAHDLTLGENYTLAKQFGQQLIRRTTVTLWTVLHSTETVF